MAAVILCLRACRGRISRPCSPARRAPMPLLLCVVVVVVLPIPARWKRSSSPPPAPTNDGHRPRRPRPSILSIRARVRPSVSGAALGVQFRPSLSSPMFAATSSPAHRTARTHRAHLLPRHACLQQDSGGLQRREVEVGFRPSSGSLRRRRRGTAGLLCHCHLAALTRGPEAESPSLVLLINDTKLLMSCV